MSRNGLLAKLRSGEAFSTKERFSLVMALALPSILAQLAHVLMSYIDAGMVGRLGSEKAASVGLVSTTTWLFGGFCMAASSGFSIVAYGACVGAGDTLIPSAINFGCMWVIRIGLALILIPRLGLVGYWTAMAVELNVRGLIFIFRVRGTKWMSGNIIQRTI